MKVIEIKPGVYEIESLEENKAIIFLILTSGHSGVKVEEWGLSVECEAWEMAEWKKSSYKIEECPVCKKWVTPITHFSGSPIGDTWSTVCPNCDHLFDED